MRLIVNFLLSLFMITILLGIGYFTYAQFYKKEIVVEDNIIEKKDTSKDIDQETFLGFVIDYEESESILNNKEEINLTSIDDTYYLFTYNNEEFSAVYTYDNWTIYDSYRVKNKKDIEIICTALIEIHPIHGKDLVSYRTSEDMAYEWLQHNIAYELLPESDFKNSAKNVDLDPLDQGKSLEEIYRSRYQ